MFRSTALAAILLASHRPALARTPAQTAQPAKAKAAGDWNGTLVTPQRTMVLGVSLKEDAPGKFSGTIGSHDNGVWDRPLGDIVFSNNALSFSVADSSSKFAGTWDGAAWRRNLHQPGRRLPAEARPRRRAALPIIAGLDGRWEGTLSTQGIQLKIVLRTKTDATARRCRWIRPRRARDGIPTTGLKRDAATVSFDVPSIRGKYEGNLSADGATLSGTWSQMGNGLPLSLVRTSESAEVEIRTPANTQAALPLQVGRRRLRQSESPRRPPRLHAHHTAISGQASRRHPHHRLGRTGPQRDADGSPGLRRPRRSPHAQGHRRAPLRRSRHRQIHGVFLNATPRISPPTLKPASPSCAHAPTSTPSASASSATAKAASPARKWSWPIPASLSS